MLLGTKQGGFHGDRPAWNPGGCPVVSTRSFYHFLVQLNLNSAKSSLSEGESLSQFTVCSCSSKSGSEVSEDTFLCVAPVLCIVQHFLEAIFVINVRVTHLCSELQQRTPHISAPFAPHDSQTYADRNSHGRLPARPT